jgi:hypothetical protein
MPATSIAQQRLMAQAHGVRLFLDSKGKEGIDPKTLNKDYREEIVDLAKSMDPKDLKDFAQTKHEGLPKRILKKESIEENATMATPTSVNGMGSVSLPGNPGTQDAFVNQKVGSGDKPNPSTTKKKKKAQFKTFRDFMSDELAPKELRTAF